MKGPTKALLAALVGAPLAFGVAHADEHDTQAAGAARSRQDVLDGDYSTFLHGPASGGKATMVMGGGWDAASDSARGDASGWLPLYGRFSLILGAHLGASEAWRPSMGVAVSLWDPARVGAQGHLLLQYKAEGFSEPEGELEMTLRSGYRWRDTSVFAELSYGQDPEGHERDAELASDATTTFGRFSVGVGARARDGMGQKQERVAWDLSAGPHLGAIVIDGHFLGLSGGLSLLSIDGATRAGVIGLASYAVAY